MISEGLPSPGRQMSPAPTEGILPPTITRQAAWLDDASALSLPTTGPRIGDRDERAPDLGSTHLPRVSRSSSSSLLVPFSKKMRVRPPGAQNVATTRGLLPRSASQMRAYRVSNVIPAYSSPVSTMSGRTYSCGLRSVPFGVPSVTKTTARRCADSPSSFVRTGGGKNAEYGSPASYPAPGAGEPICGGTPCAITVIHSHPGWSFPSLGNLSVQSVA